MKKIKTMEVDEFDKLTKEDFDNEAVKEEIRNTIRDYDNVLRLLHNCLLTVRTNTSFWDDVDLFLDKRI